MMPYPMISTKSQQLLAPYSTFGEELLHQRVDAVENSRAGKSSTSSCSLIQKHPQDAMAPYIVHGRSPATKRLRHLLDNTSVREEEEYEEEFIALSPRTLMTRNKFVCEICNQTFQREQNLQLHRRGHNLPSKLKHRAEENKNNNKKKKRAYYVCPEETCVHHNPSRALGDMCAIKKHYCRKHGEKIWACQNCSKKYAVQSDCKAHSKTCGAHHYLCHCGTRFTRRDLLLSHKAFCDKLAEESAKISASFENVLPHYHQENPPLNHMQFSPQTLPFHLSSSTNNNFGVYNPLNSSKIATNVSTTNLQTLILDTLSTKTNCFDNLSSLGEEYYTRTNKRSILEGASHLGLRSEGEDSQPLTLDFLGVGGLLVANDQVSIGTSNMIHGASTT